VPALLACHGLAFVALQLAFQRGGALATAGIATLWTNALPILAGMIIFGEPLPGGVRGVARVAAFVAVVVGAALLARSGEEEAPKASDPRRKGPRIVAGVGAAFILLVAAGTVRARTDPPLANFRELDQGSAFARELRAPGITERLWAQPPGLGGFGRRQLPAALAYAEPSAAG